MIRLTQQFGAHTGRQVAFEQPRIRLGRAPTNEIAFDPNVDLDASANHCELVLEDGAFSLVDLGSRNGTFVNGVRIQKQRVSTGDVIECGRGGPRLHIDVAPTTTLPAGSGGGYAAAAAAMAQRPSPSGYPPASPSGYPPASPNGFPAALTPAGHGAGPAAPVPNRAPMSMMNPPVPPLGGVLMPAPLYGAPPSAASPRAPAYAMQPPTSAYGGPPPGPYGAPPAGSVGASVAAGLPAGAQIGKRTVALMIDQALAQAGPRPQSSALKIVVALIVVFVVAGFGIGGIVLYRAQQADPQSAHGQGAQSQPTGGDSNGEGTSAGERVASQNETAIYMLAAQRTGANPQGFCTGFAVTSDLIATNAHCVEVARQTIQRGGAVLALRNNGRGQQLTVMPVYQDARFHDADAGLGGAGFDVGLMRTASPVITTVRLASLEECQRVHVGAPIFVFGFPGITMNEASPVATITEGVLNRSTDFFDRAADPALSQKVQHTAQTTSGSSGSPIFLASGAVIAINAGSLADEERQQILDPLRGTRVNVEVNRSSNFKYGMRADLIRAAIQSLSETAP